MEEINYRKNIMLFYVLLLTTCASAISPAGEEVLQKEFKTAFQTGRAGPVLAQLSKKFDFEELLRSSIDYEDPHDSRFSLLCSTCNVGVGELIHLVHNGTDPEVITSALKTLCVDLGIGDHILCDNFIDVAEPQLVWIIQDNAVLTGKDVCGTMFVGFGCDSDNPDRIWEVEMPDVPKPPLINPSEPEDLPTLKVLHLADTHYDPNYLPGSNANCPEKYFCCNADSGELQSPEDAAGYWGDYRNCDAPKWLLETLYDNINENYPDLDFIIWTGDLIPHAVWNTTREENLMIIKDSINLILEKFPGVPVFPALGNHESHPVNSYPQPYIDNEFDISWLYDEIKTLWMNWLPEDVSESIAYGGYYTTLIKPKLRVISVNTNYCYGLNWWLVHDSNDPASGLQWMAQELQNAEDAGELVYVISHIPPGHRDCSKTWSHQYNKIVSRYENIIVALFYGHTHKDHYVIFFDPEDATRATKIGYIAQSQTPYHNLNPGYKVYTIAGDFDGSTYRVVDHDNWVMDLDKANNGSDPEFFKLYSAMDEYGFNILSTSSWLDLVDRMAQPDSPEFDNYYRNYYKAGRPYMEETCDDKCKSDMLCRILISDNSDHSHCDVILEKIHK